MEKQQYFFQEVGRLWNRYKKKTKMRERIIAEASTIPEEYATGTHESERAALQQSLLKIYSNSLRGIFGTEVVHPIITAPATFATGAATNAIVEKYKQNFIKIETANEERSGTAEIRRINEEKAVRKAAVDYAVKAMIERDKAGISKKDGTKQKQNILVEGYEEEAPISSKYKPRKTNLQQGLQEEEYQTYDDFKARKREELISKAGYMGYVYGTGLTDFTFMPSEANLQKEYESYLVNYHYVQQQKRGILGKSYTEFKASKQKEIDRLYGLSESYLLDKGYGYLEVSLMEPRISGVEIDSYLTRKYESYLGGQPLEDISISLLGLHGHIFSKAIQNAKVYITENTPDQVSSIAGTTFDILRKVGSAAGEVIFTVGKAVLDNNQPLQADYIVLEEQLPKPSQALENYLNENLAPIISNYVKDLTPESRQTFFDILKTTEAAGGLFAITGIGGIVSKGASYVTKKAAASITEKTLTQDLKLLSKLASDNRRFAFAEGAFEVGGKATCENPTLFSVIEDTKFKKSGLGEVKTKVGGQGEKINVGISEVSIEHVENAFKPLEKNSLFSFEGGDHNGHAYLKHVNKDIAYLKNRLETDKFVGNIASTFSDAKTAERVYKDVINNNKEEIKKWLRSADPLAKRRTFSYDFKETIGYGLEKGSDILHPQSKAVVVLTKTNDGIKVITSYPTR